MRLSLRWKIVGGFGLMLGLIALLGWVTVSLFGSLRDVQRGVFDEAVPSLLAVDEVVLFYTAQSADVRGTLIGSGGGRTLDDYERHVASSTAAERKARRFFRDPAERERLELLTEAGHDFQELVEEQVIPLYRAGNRSQAFRVLDGEGARLIQEVELQGELLRNDQQDQLLGSEQAVRSTARQALAILLIVFVGVLLVGIALAIVLPRRLSRDLQALVEATRAIGRGDLEQHLEVRSRDEVEELARRFNEMQAGLKRLQQLALQDRELEIAASIQRNLLRKSMPTIPGAGVLPVQRQANLVGGDWYDVDLVGYELSVVVGDASGKGIAAALMSTIALSFLRAERGLGSDPRRVVARTNDALLDATDPDSFTTLIYAGLNLHTGELRWLNMGHPAPFCIRRDGKDGRGPQGSYLEGPRNRALGWFQEPGLAEGVATLFPGDRLIFFTDGWLDAKSADGEVFGEHRFAEALLRLAPAGTENMEDMLVEEVERWAAGKLDDDLTMLVVEFEGAPVVGGVAEHLSGEEEWHSRR